MEKPTKSKYFNYNTYLIMRKIFKFLALLVVVFALPQWAHAWIGYGLDGEDNSTWAGLTWDNTEKCLKGSFENWNGKKIRVQAYDNSKGWFGYQNNTYGISGGNSYDANIVSEGKKFIISTNDKYDVKVYLESNTFGSSPNRIVFTKANQGVATPSTLYLYSSASSWGSYKASATPSGNTFTFSNVTVTNGEMVILSTKASTTSGYDGLKYDVYTHGSGDTNIESGVESTFYNSNTGTWKFTESGTYTIVVTWNANKTGTFTATKHVQPAGPLDFSTNTNPKSAKLVFTDDNGSYDLDFSDGTWSTVVDISAVDGGYARFNVEVTKSDNTTASYGVDAGADKKEWSAAMECGTGGTYYQGALEAGKKYLVEVTGAGDDHFKFKFTEYTGPTVYLYKKISGNNVEQVGASTAPYTYSLYLSMDERLFLATKPNLTTWAQVNKSGVRYNPANDAETNIPAQNTSFAVNPQTDGNKNGVWLTTQRGRYTITVDWTNKELSATCESVPAPDVFLPLTSKDFNDDNWHYFLVGERMGEYRLQPEWELKKNGSNELVLNNRFFYSGGFAIAVVKNFEDYSNQRFHFYCDNNESSNICEEDHDYTIYDGADLDQAAGETRKNPKNRFYFTLDGDYYQGKGIFISEFKVTLDSNGVPQKFRFKKGSDAETKKNRMFALLGDNIYNRTYSNSSGTGNTPMYDKDKYKGNGWQEGWIQYDPATNRPYVDARGEYLYHTSFTPDYMLTHPVQFNQELPNGGDFVYNSSYAQFVEYNKLTDLDSDPYKDFYQAFTDKDAIKNDVKKGGENYNYDFSVNVKNGEVETPTGTWSCYVVRDMWIAGEIKFWTGWGGNDDTTAGGTGNIAVWHGPNGGPNIAVDGREEVKGFDINSKQQVTLYRNGRNINNANYVISKNKKPVYFNRVVLWYNEAGEVGESFMQFIQESAGPAILAQPMEQPEGSPEPGKKNYIQYHWYLNKVADGQDEEANRQVMAYEICRYRIVDGKAEPIGYPEGEKVDISDQNVIVSDLYEEVAGTTEKTKFTTFLDKGMVGNRGFAPGLYQYDIYVTYEGGARKLAVSNQVPIYGEIAPDAVPMQLVELRGAYKDKFGKDHISAAEQLKTIDGTTSADYTGYKYMTYRTNSEDKFYIMKDIFDSEDNNIPVDVKLIDRAVAMKFLEDHQDKYWWTSDYYVRCLDYNAYSRLIQGYIDAKTIKEESIDQVQPTLEIFDVIIPEGGSAEEAKSISRGKAHLFDFDGQKYYSAVVKRGGNLSDGTFDVKLTYSYTEKDATEAKEHTAQAAAGFDPVTPRPFEPLYRYTYARDKRENPDEGFMGYQWGKVTVPVNNWKGHASTGDAMKAGDVKDVYVKFDKDFDPRTFTLQVDFYRPNVNADIYKFYDIKYYIKLTNADTEAQEYEATKVPLDVEAVLHDKDIADTTPEGSTETEMTPNRYRMEFMGLHPRNGVYPTIEFVKTEYVPNKATDDVTGEVFKSQTGNFGKMLKFDAVRSILPHENVEGLTNVHMGYIHRSDNTWDWMYKGHVDFKDEDETLQITGSDYEDVEAYKPGSDAYCPLKPVYYLIEVKNEAGESYTYDYLVPHNEGHNTDGKDNIQVDPNRGLILNDSDPLIGTYITDGFKSDSKPTVYATAIYIFERPVDGNETGVYTNFNRLEVESFKVNGNETVSASKSSAPARVRPGVSNAEFAATGAGELPNAGVVPEAYLDMTAANPDPVTGYKAFAVVKGMTYADNTEGTVTGVEDVIADGECGESVYYNMQGMRIEKPETPGVYFRVDGKKVTKFVVK